jgi:hypothetical protein
VSWVSVIIPRLGIVSTLCQNAVKMPFLVPFWASKVVVLGRFCLFLAVFGYK